jgi:hypothetical protein
MTDLEKLIPQDTLVQVAGETIAISPLKVGQLPAFLRVISPVMAQLSAPQIDWLALFGERGDDLLTAIGIAVRKAARVGGRPGRRRRIAASSQGDGGQR